MTEKEKEEKKISPLGQTLEDEGYTGVAKYLKAFSLGYNGEAESFVKGVKDRNDAEASKLKQLEKENNEFRKKIDEGNTQTQEKLDNLNQEKIQLIKAGKVDEANAVANKMNNIVNMTAKYVDSINQNYGMGVNGKPLADITIDVSAYDTRQYTVKKIDGKEFAIPKDDEGNNFAYNSQSNRLEAIVSDGTTSIDENGRVVQPKGVGTPYASAFEINSEESKYNSRTLYKDGQEVKVYSKKEEQSYTDKGFTPVKQESQKDKSPITKPQMSLFLAEMDSKQQKGEKLTTIEKAKVKRFNEYLTTEGDVKRSASEKGLIILSKYEDVSNIGQITNEDIRDAQKADRAAGIKLGEVAKKTINDAEKTLSALDKLNTFVGNLKEEEIERGMFDNIKNKAKTLLSDKSFDSLSEDQKKATLLTVTANTKIGSALADYIKSISGTAVAQAEYDRLLKVLTGGDASNIQTLQTSISTFYEDKKSAYIEDLSNNLYEYGAYGLNKQRNFAKKYGATKPKEKDKLDLILGF